MSIIYAKRIPSQLEGAESCGPSQQWDPNYVFNGIKGQCTPKGSPMAAGSSNIVGAIFGGLSALLKPATPAPTAGGAPAYVPPSGMSPNTMIALGLGAAGLVALVLITRK